MVQVKKTRANGMTLFIKDPFNAMKGALLADSPLLASLIQSLLDMLFK
jgi:hypothetical protein